MNKELRETSQHFLTVYEQTKNLPIPLPTLEMKHSECCYFLEWAVKIISKCVADDKIE